MNIDLPIKNNNIKWTDEWSLNAAKTGVKNWKELIIMIGIYVSNV